MLNNINTTGNETAFKASLRVTAPVKNSAQLKNIQTLFSEKTKDMRQVLSISKVEEFGNMECLYSGTNPMNSVGVFFKESLDTMMERLSDNDIATKLVKTLKSLKELNKRETLTSELEDSLFRAQHEEKRNLKIASNCRDKGHTIMAERFEFLASCFRKKADKIQDKQNIIHNNAIEKLEKIAEGDSDITNFANMV